MCSSAPLPWRWYSGSPVACIPPIEPLVCSRWRPCATNSQGLNPLYRKGYSMLAHIRHIPFITLILGLLLAGCSGASQPEAAQLEAEPIEEFVPVISATGEVVPVRWALLGAPTSGIVAELLVGRGDLVQAGEPLARLGDRQAAEAVLAAARLALVTGQQAPQNLPAGGRGEG